MQAQIRIISCGISALLIEIVAAALLLYFAPAALWAAIRAACYGNCGPTILVGELVGMVISVGAVNYFIGYDIARRIWPTIVKPSPYMQYVCAALLVIAAPLFFPNWCMTLAAAWTGIGIAFLAFTDTELSDAAAN